MDLLDLVNSEAGKYLLGIKDSDIIVKISPNSIHKIVAVQKDRLVIEARFFASNTVERILSPITETMQIAHEEYKPIEDKYDAFLHYSGLKTNYNKYPFIYLSTTFNPVTGDGQVAHSRTDPDTWALTRADANGTYYQRGSWNGFNSEGMEADRVGASWYLARCFYAYDTSSITAPATILSATKRVYVGAYTNNNSVTHALVLTAQASVSSLVNSDFSALTLNSPTEGATRITFGANQYNTFTLNASGLGWISKTGYTKLGIRSSIDIDNSSPTLANAPTMNYSGAANKPELIVTYSLPSNVPRIILSQALKRSYLY